MTALSIQRAGGSAAGVGSPPVLAAHMASVGVTIGGRAVLSDLSLDIRAGSLVALLGVNGAGKSTLLRVLATLLAPERGAVALFGHDARRAGAALRARIGLIGHQLMLYRDLTVLENLELFARLYGLPRARRAALDALDRLALRDCAGSPVRALSRGMAQGVSIARAILHGPQLLLADEPYTGLDGPSAARVDSCLAGLHAGGCTIVLTGHELRDARGLAARVLVLNEGRLTLDAAPADIGTCVLSDAMGGRP